MTLLTSLRVRKAQGSQYIPNLRAAVPAGFRGLPIVQDVACATGCEACAAVCPTRAIAINPVRIDLGRCVFCGACAEQCPAEKLLFTPVARMGATQRSELEIQAGSFATLQPRASEAFSNIFGRSLRLRQVSAGGCNACELELNAAANVNFDAQRFGIEWVASPRHADALVVTGPLTRNMQDALRLAWDAMPEPRFIIAVGACAISGGLYEGAAGVDRSFFDAFAPSLFVPGCPPHPLTFVNAILDFLGVE